MLDRGRILFVYGIFYPEGGDARFEAKHIVFLGRTAQTSSSSSARTGGSSRSARSPTSTSTRSSPDGEHRLLATTARRSPLEGDKLAGHAAGDRHDLAPGLRLRDRLPADRRGPVPRGGREGHRVPARPPAHASTPAEGIVVLVPRRRHRGRQRAEDPRLRVRRRLRRDPGLRADLRAGRPDPDVPRHRRPAHPRDIEHDASSCFRPLLPRPRGRRLLLAHRPDHVRPAQRVARRRTRRARTGTRSATTPRRT